MRFFRIGSLLLSGCLLLHVAVAAESVMANDSQFAADFRPVFENLLKDKETAKWVDKILYDVIRHGLDRKVANIIAEDEFVKKNRPLIDAVMREIGDYGRNLLRSRGAESAYADRKAGVPAQYASVRNAAQRLAKFFNFSKEMRSNLNVFVVDSPIVNAFAYGSLNTIEIALFTGLIEKLNEVGDPITAVSEMVKGTIAHELSHVKNRHVEQRLIVISIFLSTWKNIIPTSMQENYRDLVKDHVMQSLYGIDPQEALSSNQSALYRELFDYSWDTIERLTETIRISAQAEPEKFEALFSKLNHTFSSYDGVKFLTDSQNNGGEGAEIAETEVLPLSEAEAQAGQKLLARYGMDISLDQLLNREVAETNTEQAEAKGEAIEAGKDVMRTYFFADLIRFILALSKLSRSQEVTCDRFEQIATSEQTVQRSFARMGGGRDASPEAMMQQAEKWASDLSKDPTLQKYLNEGFLSHPVILMRVYQTMLFSKSAALKAHQSPIYKALMLYMEGMKKVEKSEQVLEGKTNSYSYGNTNTESVADSKEAYEIYLETEKATPFKAIVRNFGEVIADSIIASEATSAEELNIRYFAELVDYLQTIKRDRGDSSIPKKRLSTPGTEEKIEGLLYTINHRLRNLTYPEGF